MIASDLSLIMAVIASIALLPLQQASPAWDFTTVHNLPNVNISRRARSSSDNSHSRNNDGCGFAMRIRNENSYIDEFPWVAMLLYAQNFRTTHEYHCGGVLINRNHVVTAAHCVIGTKARKKPLKFVRLNKYDPCRIEEDFVYCSETKIDVRPLNITVHPEYNVYDHYHHHDIALIKIDSDPLFSKFLRPICLPEAEMDNGMAFGKKLIVSGWGRINVSSEWLDSNASSPVKLSMMLPFVETEICKRMFHRMDFEVGKGQICAGHQRGRTTCNGDSGYPLMHYDAAKRVWVLTGIVTVGAYVCGNNGIPRVYTNVREYLPWIKQHAGLKKGNRTTRSVNVGFARFVTSRNTSLSLRS